MGGRTSPTSAHAYLLPPVPSSLSVKGVMARNELRWLRMRDDDASAELIMTPKNRKSIPFNYFGLGI